MKFRKQVRDKNDDDSLGDLTKLWLLEVINIDMVLKAKAELYKRGFG